MIIQIRGTSGAGKTYAMRTVMEALKANHKDGLVPTFVDGRRNPFYYTAKDKKGYPLTIVGSYESACGGVDTIHGYDTLQSLLKDRYPQGDIIMEGLLLSEDVKQTTQMFHQRMDLRIIFLSTPLDTCLERVGQRRKARGDERALNPANTSNRVRTIARARVKLEALGIPCYTNSSEQAPKTVLRWINE